MKPPPLRSASRLAASSIVAAFLATSDLRHGSLLPPPSAKAAIEWRSAATGHLAAADAQDFGDAYWSSLKDDLAQAALPPGTPIAPSPSPPRRVAVDKEAAAEAKAAMEADAKVAAAEAKVAAAEKAAADAAKKDATAAAAKVE